MLEIFKKNGKMKAPVKAYRTHGSEFLIYVTDFTVDGWDDIYSSRIAILTVRPQHPQKVGNDLKKLMHSEGLDAEYNLVGFTL
jgi:hypothetical protein